MKKIALSVLALSMMVAGQAAHASPAIPELECTAVHSGSDFGYQLEISALPHSYKSVQEGVKYIATLSMQTIMGPRPVAVYSAQKKMPTPLGSSLVYSGKNFELEVVNSAPVQKGIYSRLTAETKNGRIVEEMYCRFVR